MFEPNAEGQVRLYFTEEKICIGSYKEVEKYERETKNSYWASDFFELPPDYNPIGKTVDEIKLAVREVLLSKLLKKSLGL
ncbi:MAG: hypothetical protein HWQ35_28970 [Nostoc sp. NMS1]|uniref:hypothetical protein n=1 Tax=unclassified Nostoc TaxID=2593658 RepID=UPI0025F96450|nr:MULTISPECIES: hypothetical protein [unclassified Nostoc]MBN3910429.1 hypothetical protein [Nostoc sp. NMS1]MBN3992610.1 hypothetical protein [Nostoc sp. NMS2]